MSVCILACMCFPSLGFAYVRLFIVCIIVSVVDFLNWSFLLGTFYIAGFVAWYVLA